MNWIKYAPGGTSDWLRGFAHRILRELDALEQRPRQPYEDQEGLPHTTARQSAEAQS